jgi:hypothetical protein
MNVRRPPTCYSLCLTNIDGVEPNIFPHVRASCGISGAGRTMGEVLSVKQWIVLFAITSIIGMTVVIVAGCVVLEYSGKFTGKL